MRFLADENIPAALVHILRKSGHDVSNSPNGVGSIRPNLRRSEGLDVSTAPPGGLDREVAAMAQRENRALLTQDKHLANILEYPPESYPGIILLRIAPPLIGDLERALSSLFAHFAAEEMAGKLFVLDKDGIRVRE